MNTSRFDYGRQTDTTSRTFSPKYPKWVRVSRISGPVVRDSARFGRKKIFVIQLPMRVGPDNKTIRRILIFDNHPDSLRLASRQLLNRHVDLPQRPSTNSLYILLALFLILTLTLGLLWPLL